MLKGNNDQQLSAQNIYECAIPFYQIWQELVSEKTLDVYQYRVLNSLNALKEFVEVMKKTIKGLFNSDANVEACKEEILDILKKDRILRKHYKALLNRAQKAVSSGHKSIAEKTRI